MREFLYKLSLLMMVLLLNNCQKENSEYPCSYRLVEITKNPIEVYTETDTVENHRFTVDNIVGNDWFNINTINEINFKSSKNASLKFNESERKELLDFFYSNLTVNYKNDSIYFTGKIVNLSGRDDTVSVKGISIENTIQIFGVFFALNNTLPQGIEYGEFNKNNIFKLSTEMTDTLALFHFTLKYEKK